MCKGELFNKLQREPAAVGFESQSIVLILRG